MACLALTGIGWSLFHLDRSTEFGYDFGNQDRDLAERSYEVSEPLFVVVKNFAGTVIVRRGESDRLDLVTTKKARNQGDLERIQLEVNRRDGTIEIESTAPGNMNNASVKIELTVPARTSLEVRMGAGTVDADGITGLVDIDCGAGTVILKDIMGETGVELGTGTIDAERITGNVHMSTGAGTILYEGEPEGDCRFSTGRRHYLADPAGEPEHGGRPGDGGWRRRGRLPGGRRGVQETRSGCGGHWIRWIDPGTHRGGIDLGGASVASAVRSDRFGGDQETAEAVPTSVWSLVGSRSW